MSRQQGSGVMSGVLHDLQADFMPTSSLSPGSSPQQSPDSQQKDLPVGSSGLSISAQQKLQPYMEQYANPISNFQQDGHISQSDVPPSIMSQNCEQTANGLKISKFETESQMPDGSVAAPGANKMLSPRPSDSSNLHSPTKVPQKNLTSRNQPPSQGKFQTDSNSPIPSVPVKQTVQPKSQSLGHPARPPAQPNLPRPPFAGNSGPRPPQAMRMSSPPRPTRMQFGGQTQIRQNVPQQSNSGGQQNPQQFPQQQQRMQHQQPSPRFPQQQNQRPMNPPQSGAGSMNQGRRMISPGFNTQPIRPQGGAMSPNRPRMPSPQVSQNHSTSGQNQAIRPAGPVGQGMQSPAINRPVQNQQVQNPRMPSQQSQAHPMSNPPQPGQMPQMQGFGEEGNDMNYDDFDDEGMYYDEEEDEDYDEEDMEEEEMDFHRYPHHHPDYGYPSSDSDELSEEESALLEELRNCDNDERYDEIMCRLREKGVDPDDIDEMMYPDEHFGDGEEEVSSSSQNQMQYQNNQGRPQAGMVPSIYGGQNEPIQNQSVASSVPSTANRQQMQSAASGGYNQQGVSAQKMPGQPAGSSPMTSAGQGQTQQTKVPAPQGMQVQQQQQNPDTRPSASVQAGSQVPTPQSQPQGQQPQLKLMGQGSPNQQRKVFQSSPAQPSQGTSQPGNWQPLQNIVRGQTPVRPEIKSTPPKAIPQAGQALGMQPQRAQAMNRPPQPMPQTQAQTVRPQGQAQNNPSGMVVRPVQHLTIMPNNNQSTSPGQAGQNRPMIVRHGVPGPQMVINTVPSNQPGGFMGAPTPTQSPMMRTGQMQPRPQGHIHPGMGQSHGVNRPMRPANQNLVHSPRLQAALNKDTAPSEASLSRLLVQYMQQSLDQEIKAKNKKGVHSGPDHQMMHDEAQHTQTFNSPNRFPAQHMNQFPQGPLGQTLRPQQQQQQQQTPYFSSYQPKHQLPPRQPIPAIVNPNTAQGVSGGRPICSVVPFTSQNRGQISATSTTAQRPNTPQLNANCQRPRNPTPSTQQVANVPQQVPAMVPNRMSAPNAQQNVMPVPNSGPASLAPRGPAPASMAPAPANMAPASANMAPPVPKTDQTQQQQLSLPQQQQHQQPFQQQQQQQQQEYPPQPSPSASCKSESFSLDRLSEDKCVIAGKGKQQGLTVNMVYQIRSPIDNTLVYALWNGEHFVDLKQSDVKAVGQSGQPSSGVPASQKQGPEQVQGGQAGPASAQATPTGEKTKVTPASSSNNGTSEYQAKFLQSLNRKIEPDEQSWSSTEAPPPASQNANMEQGQVSDLQKSNTDQTTYVKPLPQGQIQQKQEETVENEADDDSIFKKPFSENEESFRVCNHCGYTSKNFQRCEGCKKVFQGKLKIHTLKKNPTPTSSTSPTGNPASKTQGEDGKEKQQDACGQIMSGVSFYGNQNARGRGRGRGGSGRTRGGGMKGRMGARGNPDEGESSDSDDSSMDGKGSNDSGTDGQVKRRPTRPKAKNPTPRKRSKKLEPVTVTISSDEDEPSSTSNNFHAPSPAGSESPIFPSTPSEPVNAFGRFRRALMEDEMGNSKLSKKIQQRVLTPMMERGEDEEEDEDDENEDGDEPPVYEIDIRSVRIGSMRTQPEGPLLMNLQGVCFRVRSERTDETFECEIIAQEVEHVKFCTGQSQPVLFLFLTQECGEKLRNICHMESGDDEYFDPSSTDMKQKMVVIIIEGFNYTPSEMLQETLSLWADMNQTEDESFIEELSEESANDLLIQSAPPVLTADVERDIVKFKKRYIRESNEVRRSMSKTPGSPSDSTDNEPDSTSSSPPEIKHHHFGTSVRLLQYPFPPARGIPITTEDLFCLTEGEFLNDVIIDFYLQYLYKEKLSEENRKRTHIFSSFFYKRLTQRDRHSEKTEEDAKKSLPERRHARVKKWTKTVDLFDKDFIIVPINEHSHWYLAVICFPGLASQEVVPFIPSTSHKADVDEESSETQGGEEGTNEEATSHDTATKTILGRQLDTKACLDSDDSTYNLGQKQPCILMFDSLAGPSRNPNVRMLREYLQCEWNAKKSEARQIAKILRGSTPKVPQQSNYSDCGVYLLQYVESFFEDPIADFQIPMKGLQNWFPEEIVHNKRQEIHELIMDLHRRYQEERGDPHILDIKFESSPREPPMKYPPMEQNSKGEENMGPGYSRDDDSSNSSLPGDGSIRSEMPASAQGDASMDGDAAMEVNSSEVPDQIENSQEETNEKLEDGAGQDGNAEGGEEDKR